MNLGTSRKVVILAVGLLAGHVLVLALHRALLSNLVELALAAVTAAAAYQTAQRARGFARRFWRLIGVSFTLYTLGQVFYTYYDSILHASPLIWWPSDALLLFYVAPMVMTLFLGDDSAEASAFSSQRQLDFLQVGIVTLSTYLFFFYEPWQSGASPQAMAMLVWRVEIVRDVVITAAFALRALLTRSRLVRSLFGRVALFLLVFSVGDLVYVYVQTWGAMPNASWYELLWTVPRTLLIGLAAGWNPPEETEPAPDKVSAEPLLLAQFAHIALPLLVLITAAHAQRKQLVVAVIAVAASFACSSARLVLGQRAQQQLRLRQEQTAESLRAAEEKYRNIFENAVNGIFQVTPDGRYTAANPALVKMLGYDSAEELLRSRTYNAKENYADPALKGQFQDLLRWQGEVHNFEYEIVRKDGKKIWTSEHLKAIRDDSGKIVAYEGTVQDITEQRKLQLQLQKAQRMESLGTLAGGIAHDFNNLLTVISGYSTLLMDGLAENPRLHPAAEQIHKAGQRAVALTRQLLVFSRHRIMQGSTVNLNMVITNMMQMLQRLIGEDIDVQTVLAADLHSVKADAGQLEQVIMNLAVNARDALPEGGKLMVQTSNIVLDEDFVKNNVGSRAGLHVLLVVSDNGTGMNPETREQIFDPFFTTKEAGRGTGLGLAVVYGIVKQSKGYITVHSEVGHGATFRIYLPAEERAAERQAASASVARSPSPRGTETILLVEDDPAVRALANSILRDKGYAVLAPQHATEAEQICAQHPGPIHLLLTDLVMPGMNGRELARRAAALRPQIRVLYMSGYTDDALVRHQVSENIFAFIQKPFAPALLEAKVREVLDSVEPSTRAFTASD
ncbi:MAG: ATP-binding protein [Terriglobales bacterium]